MSRYRELFDRLDKDQSGNITRDEIEEAVSELNLNVDSSKIDLFFNRIDVNGDGKISYPEFEAFVNTHNPENAEVMGVLNGLNSMMPSLKKMSRINSKSDVDRNVRRFLRV